MQKVVQRLCSRDGSGQRAEPLTHLKDEGVCRTGLFQASLTNSKNIQSILVEGIQGSATLN